MRTNELNVSKHVLLRPRPLLLFFGGERSLLRIKRIQFFVSVFELILKFCDQQSAKCLKGTAQHAGKVVVSNLHFSNLRCTGSAFATTVRKTLPRRRKNT